MRNCADVIIIGSGVIGNAAAYYLAQKAALLLSLRKAIVLAMEVLQEMVEEFVSQDVIKRASLAMYGVKNIWPTLSEELEIDVEYYQHGNLRLGKTEEHMGILKNLTKSAKDCGLDVRMISAEEGRNICPYLSEEVIGASWCPTDGHANPLLTTLGYYRRARQIGVRFITGEEVMEIKR